MSGVELVVAALAAGTSAGLTDTVSSAVRDAYGALRAAALRRLPGGGAELLDAEQVEPDVWEARLREELTASGADRDRELLALAENLLALLGSGGKYRVDARGAKGVQIGDHNTQTVNFG
ncbi:hypothetical protein [Kitasatospora sp. NPDC057223]|uniref:hypothetical protein n=1 Tax=Kitasatospora sp. NPDC057223 TaxID=3346055 RepID=UPI0036344A0A